MSDHEVAATPLGHASYDTHEFGSEWWFERAKSRPHRAAYKRIAETAAQWCPQATEIIDYACGPALLLRELVKVFPQAHCLGIDESEIGLKAGKTVLSRARLGEARQRISLQQQALPDFSMEQATADVVIFSFPDFRSEDEDEAGARWAQLFPDDHAEALAVLETVAEEHEDSPQEAWESLLIKRIAHRHIRSLVRPGGIFIRVDYANCEREECDEGLLEQMMTYEGSHVEHAPFFALQHDFFQPSQVMQDVYAQTGNPDDVEGGYLVSVFKAI